MEVNKRTALKFMPVFWLFPLLMMAMHPARHPAVGTPGFGLGSGLSAGLLIGSIFADGSIGKIPTRALLGTAGILAVMVTISTCL